MATDDDLANELGAIEGMIGEHPFGISDAAIDEIMEAIAAYGASCEHAGWRRGYRTAATVEWNAGWSVGYDNAMNGPK